MGLRLDLGAFHQLTLTEVNVLYASNNAYNKENINIECLGADVGGSKLGDPHGHGLSESWRRTWRGLV